MKKIETKKAKNTIYIDFSDSNNNYKKTRKYFDSFDDAMKFMVETFDTVNSDFINYTN